MWRSRNEEWGKRQHYLLQSMIDTPRLSTIPETDELNSETRGPSPLPELIIEKEKNRHDEPEEFYQALEVKMKKLYKKLFLGTDDDSIDETSNSLEQCQHARDSSQLNVYEDSLTEDSDMSDTYVLNEGSNNMVQDNFTESEKSLERVEREKSPSLAHEIIVTQAIVHREAANDDFQDSNNNEITNNNEIVISRSRSTQPITFELTHEKIDYSSKYRNTQQRVPERLVVRQGLSTIPETDELNSETREPSPLPKLIIEKEKNRHDEPEEFYQAVEVKMKKLYKKLFLGTDDDSIDETLNSLEQSQHARDSSQLNVYEDSLTEDSDMSDTYVLNEGSNNMVQDNFTESEKSLERVEREKSPSLAHEIIVTQAIVHREAANADFQDSNNNEITNNNEIAISRSRCTQPITFEPTHEKIDYSSKYRNTQQRVPERLVVRQAKADREIKTDEIEVMRQAGSKSKSLGSIAEETTQSKETDSLTLLGGLEVKAMTLIPNTSPETLADSDSSQENILNKAFHLNKSDKSTTKRPSSCFNVYEGTQNKKKKLDTALVSVQTDPIKRNLN